jgi:glycosyltransferase involved in cell wall biosynthesis
VQRTVLINAGPWMPVPPHGYGGIENVVAELIAGLRRRGVGVVLATVGESSIEVEEKIWVYEEGQYVHVLRPYTASSGIPHAHMLCVLQRIRSGGIDLVHDHLEVVGPSMLSTLDERCPPVLQTLHWDLRKHPDFYSTFDGRGRIVFNGVSQSQVALAPANLRSQVLRSIPLGVDPTAFPFEPVKDGYFVVLGRITPPKGQDIAARVCLRKDRELILAGPIGGIPTPEQLAAELESEHSPAHALPDVRYYLEQVQPLVDGQRIRWIGAVTGPAKLKLLGRARALLMPVRWDEPGGTVLAEAMACGTPVVGLNRGCLPEVVEHGVTGFLADDEDELAKYLERVDEIDPAACRRAVETRFSSDSMAGAYCELYEQVIACAGAQAPTARRPALADATGS